MTLYKYFFCLQIQQEIQEMLRLSISILWHQFFLNLFFKTIKYQIDFIFYIDAALDLPQNCSVQ